MTNVCYALLRIDLFAPETLHDVSDKHTVEPPNHLAAQILV